MQWYATAALMALIGFSTIAVAQQPSKLADRAVADEGCLCVVPIDAQAPGPVATVSEAEGPVLLVDTAGYTPIRSRIGLTLEDSVVLLQGAKATLTAGTECQARLVPGSVISITASKNGACISQAHRIVPAQDIPEEDQELSEEDRQALIIGAGLGLAGGIAALLLLSQDDDDGPVSP